MNIELSSCFLEKRLSKEGQLFLLAAEIAFFLQQKSSSRDLVFLSYLPGSTVKFGSSRCRRSHRAFASNYFRFCECARSALQALTRLIIHHSAHAKGSDCPHGNWSSLCLRQHLCTISEHSLTLKVLMMGWEIASRFRCTSSAHLKARQIFAYVFMTFTCHRVKFL